MVQVLIFSDRNHIYHDPNSLTGFTATGLVRYCGTYRVATELRNAGYSCMVIENFSFASLDTLFEIAKKYVGKETLFVGLASTFLTRRTDIKRKPEFLENFPQIEMYGREPGEIKELFNYIRSLNPQVKFVVGGSRVKLNGKDPYTGSPDLEFFDYYFSGLADRSVVQLANYLSGKTESIVTRQIIQPEYKNTRLYITDEDYPFNDYSNCDIVLGPNDLIFPGETISMEIARGCIFNCSYCDFGLLGKKYNDWTRNAKTIRENIIRNHDLFGTTNFWFVDDLINDSMEKVQLIYDVIEKLPFKIRWRSYARLDLFWKHRNMAKMLLDMGCDHVQMGIETFNKDVGKHVGKGLGEPRIIDTLDYLHSEWGDKINIFASFIVGLPGDTEKNVERVLDYISKKDCAIHQARFFPLFVFARQKAEIEKLGYKVNHLGMVPNHWTKEGEIDSFQTAFNIAEMANKESHDIIVNRMFKTKRFFEAFFSWPLRPMHTGLNISKKEYTALKTDPKINLQKMIDFMWAKESARRNEYLDLVLKHEYKHTEKKIINIFPNA